MKAYRYTIKDADGVEGTIILNETEAFKLCAAMTKDLYGTEAALNNIVRTEQYVEKAVDLPENVEVFGTWTTRRFKKARGQMYVWQNNQWELDAHFWYKEDARGKYRML